jgi:hypothetical protein
MLSLKLIEEFGGVAIGVMITDITMANIKKRVMESMVKAVAMARDMAEEMNKVSIIAMNINSLSC